jgi:hypothetical protein
VLKDNRLGDMHPVAVRFRRTDLSQVRAAAAHANEILTLWARETVLLRLSRERERLVVPKLVYEPLEGRDEPISIRFRPLHWIRVERAAKREGVDPSTWIRAVLLSRTKDVLAEVA